MSHKYVYLFSEGDASMRNLLGGKGANLAEMTNLGLPVPQGFTITTEACTKYYEDGRQINPEIQAQIMEYIEKMEKITGKKFGDLENPLLVSVRSGASVNIVASKGDWYKIEYGTGYGYVLKSYVRLNDSSSSGSDSSGSSSSGSSSTATTTTSVNLRAKGTTASDKLGTFAKGTKVTVLDKGSSWSKVEVSGKTGYMLNSYLKFK